MRASYRRDDPPSMVETGPQRPDHGMTGKLAARRDYPMSATSGLTTAG